MLTAIGILALLVILTMFLGLVWYAAETMRVARPIERLDPDPDPDPDRPVGAEERPPQLDDDLDRSALALSATARGADR